MTNLRGVYPPIISIFDENGNFDVDANKKQADYLIKNGVDGITYLGTSGEFYSMNAEQKKKVLDVMLPYVKGRTKVIVGVGECNLQDTLDMVRYVEKIGADAILLVNPYFNVYSDNMIIAYYNKVVRSTNLSVLIYNIPDLTGYNFSPDVVKTILKNNENIIGIKESLNDLDHVKSIIEVKNVNPDFAVYVAYENLAYDGLNAGADGFINATANFAPEFTVNTYKAFVEGDLEKCREYAGKMKDSMEIYNFSKPIYLACKQAVYFRVIGQDRFEILPALSLKNETKNKIYEAMKKLELFQEEDYAK
ncbi:MAG: dihydrodipicolinate synthase family protein [Clostridium sp.]|jgi:4-hydroxy-tetrahydrodipicolinate synthase|uniref:dihydrodipicolinate synthase family protein n=1 Tax=Clostridium sp. TaxID=1506 RepID=UPI0025BC0FAA|nr:dihydrodipicolinate synthase family protein [Clostridium sp.]MCH3964906.1 dihydrodipicolinate synthase family protein [Clostridium sp.]MCI1716600.1 dihydrodipicolinate synthase family protein [Clostridium sp.]MCI1800918.1 dihydrodipicolinate synthase family protein [Clostridium sp.]MCI1814777.1 dihydrodipicolinate synthase family protein [Clostridium sp.]MCI1871665.1 dihydrodipicolinate synthase family protein [Clostridium sp.]